MKLAFAVIFALVCAVAATAPLAKIVPVADSAALPSVSLVASGEKVSAEPAETTLVQEESKTKESTTTTTHAAAPAAPAAAAAAPAAAPEHHAAAAAAPASHPAAAEHQEDEDDDDEDEDEEEQTHDSDHSDAQVAVATSSSTEASEAAMEAEEEALANKNGWSWGASGSISFGNGDGSASATATLNPNPANPQDSYNNYADGIAARRQYNEQQSQLSRRQARRAWMMLRFRTRCPQGAEGDNCRAVRLARWKLYRRARRRYMRQQWKTYGVTVKRRCRGPWTHRCPEGDDGRMCRSTRRRWRRKCRRVAWVRRRRSCKGPWTERCPAGDTQAGASCRRTRRNWRRQCRIRRNLRNWRRRSMNNGNSRIAKFRARLLNSRSSYLVAHKRLRFIYIGRNRVLEWRPKTGYFQIFKVHRRSMNRISSRPVWRKRERIVYGRWAKLVKPWRLVYIGKNRLLAHNKKTGRYRIYRVRFSVTGNNNPLLLKAKGYWRRARRRSLIYLGGRRLVTFRRRTGRYVVWKVNRKIVGENVRAFKRVTTNSSWLFSRRRAKYAYVGRGTLLQWHRQSYRLINFRRRARLNQPAFRYVKGGHMDIAMKRKWPFRSGHPNVHITYLGGKMLLFYRTKRSSRIGASGKPLKRVTLFPFKIIALNNPLFKPVASAPNLVNRPWDTNANWAQSAAYKPWLNDPKYCVSYTSWQPAGKIIFSRRGAVSKLSSSGSRRRVITRVGRMLLDWSPYTGSYRVMRYNKVAKMFVQRSFGVFPNFKQGWRLVAFGKNRLLTYNSSTREYVLYPVGRSRIRRPIAQGTLNIRRGYRLIALGRRQVLAWKPRTGQWKVYRVNPDVTGVNVSPLRRMIAGGQWCDIRKGSTVLALSKRNIMVVDKRTGVYSLYRFNPWAKGRRGNVFKKVLARGTWADPFLNGRTRLVALRGSRVLGWQPRRGGALFSVWYVGYESGGSAAGDSAGPIGSVSVELKKLVRTLKNMKRFIQLKGKNIDPSLRLLATPQFGGMKFRDLKQMFSSYLSDVKVPFPWQNTLKFFRNRQRLRAQGVEPVDNEESDGALPSNIYSLPAANTNPLQEQAPVLNQGATVSQNARAISGGPRLPSNYPVVPKGPTGFPEDNDIWPDGDGMPTAEMVNGVAVPAPGSSQRKSLSFPDGTVLKSGSDDVFDDGTGPVAGSSVPKMVNPLSSKVDMLLEEPIEYPQFPQEVDPMAAWDNVAFRDAMAQNIPMSKDEYVNGMGRSKFLHTIDDTKEHYNNLPDFKSPSLIDDSMQDDDQTSRGLTRLERQVPGSVSDGPGKMMGEGVFSRRERPDPVGDQMAAATTIYPAKLKDYVGRKDKLNGMIVPGDGEPPLDVIH